MAVCIFQVQAVYYIFVTAGHCVRYTFLFLSVKCIAMRPVRDATTGCAHAAVLLLLLSLLVHAPDSARAASVSTTTTTPVPTTTPAPEEGLSTAVIVALAVGIPVLVIAIAVGVWWFSKQKRKNEASDDGADESLMGGMKARIGGSKNYYQGFTFSRVPTLDASPDKFFS